MLVDEEDQSKTYVHLGTCDVFIGGTAKDVRAHTERLFDDGQEMVRLRAQLEEQRANPDHFAPLIGGGVMLHKVKATLHDTCNPANKSAELVKKAAWESGEKHFGADAWAEMGDERTLILDYLCANHSRGLPIDAFNRGFCKFLKEVLGAQLEAAEKAGAQRIEADGEALVRSISKLCCDGVNSYEKGNGVLFTQFIAGTEWEGILIASHERGSRQDWVVEASVPIYLHISNILKYTDNTRRLDANILRDSILSGSVRFIFKHAFTFVRQFLFLCLKNEGP